MAARTSGVTEGSVSWADSRPTVNRSSASWPDPAPASAPDPAPASAPDRSAGGASTASTPNRRAVPATVAVSVPTWSSEGESGNTPAVGTAP
jgi:hypothetical protein